MQGPAGAAPPQAPAHCSASRQRMSAKIVPSWPSHSRSDSPSLSFERHGANGDIDPAHIRRPIKASEVFLAESARSCPVLARAGSCGAAMSWQLPTASHIDLCHPGCFAGQILSTTPLFVLYAATDTLCSASSSHTTTSRRLAPLTAMDSGRSPKQAGQHAKRRAEDPEQQR